MCASGARHGGRITMRPYKNARPCVGAWGLAVGPVWTFRETSAVLGNGAIRVSARVSLDYWIGNPRRFMHYANDRPCD